MIPMESTYHGGFERSDPVLATCSKDVRELGLEYYRILRDAVSVEPRAVAEEFGLTSANQAYMLTNMQEDQLRDLGQIGGLPYEIQFTPQMFDAVLNPADKTDAFHEQVVESASGERFGRRTVSWRLKETMWRSRQWFVCREVLRADEDLGKLVFGLPDRLEVARITAMTGGELMGLALASKSQFRLPQTVPGQLATVFSDANSLKQIVLTFRMAAGATQTMNGSR